MSIHDFKIIFVIGPSGVGKNWFLGQVVDQSRLEHIDIDVKGHFDAFDLKSEWIEFIKKGDCQKLADRIHDRTLDKNCKGVFVLLPSTKALNLKIKRINNLKAKGHSTILLWGEKELCKKSRIERDSKSRIKFNEIRYESKNNRLFDEFHKSEYDPYRIEMFDENKNRRTVEDILNQISNKCLI